MDLTAAGFYGVVCGTLAAAAPTFRAFWLRVAVGAVVGVAAVYALPHVRTWLDGAL